jgi:hypothetical protein
MKTTALALVPVLAPNVGCKNTPAPYRLAGCARRRRCLRTGLPFPASGDAVCPDARPNNASRIIKGDS